MFTTNAELVTRVYASFSYNDVFPEVDDNTDELPEDFDLRLQNAYDAFAREVKSAFPNARDIWIESTGWNGDCAQFSPRADNPELDLDYEYFFDWLDGVQGTLAS